MELKSQPIHKTINKHYNIKKEIRTMPSESNEKKNPAPPSLKNKQTNKKSKVLASLPNTEDPIEQIAFLLTINSC